MISRPLELTSRLRPAARGFDALFYVNAGLIVVFFGLFGSRFVAAPGLRSDVNAERVQLPQLEGAASNGMPTSHVLIVWPNGIYDLKGVVFPEDLDGWLRTAAAEDPEPSLLIVADQSVRFGQVESLEARARRAGFHSVVYAANEPDSGSP